MESTLEKIREIIEEPMKNMDIIVDQVSWEKVDKYNYLIIILDKETGLDISSKERGE